MGYVRGGERHRRGAVGQEGLSQILTAALTMYVLTNNMLANYKDGSSGMGGGAARDKSALVCKDGSCAEVGPTVSRRKRVGLLLFSNLATRSRGGRMMPKLTRS